MEKKANWSKKEKGLKWKKMKEGCLFYEDHNAHAFYDLWNTTGVLLVCHGGVSNHVASGRVWLPRRVCSMQVRLKKLATECCRHVWLVVATGNVM